VRGTQVTSFDVEILDIVAGDPAAKQPYILLRASGPAVAATGLGQGFSGSPIWCPGSDGVPRIVGAVSEAIGQYGNDVALATPIGLVLGEPIEAPAAVRVAPALLRSARPLAAPLSVSGLSPAVGRALQTAAARAGRVVYAAPGRARQAPAEPQPLVPGSSVAVGFASGDLTASAVGTVAYVDGENVWAFGHPFESAGRRRLFLQDAYVYTVIGNPTGAPELVSYKLAAPAGDRGTITNDGISAVTGRLGALPPSIPMKVIARDEDSGRLRVAALRVADERSIGLPTGASALAQVGPVAVAQMAYGALGATPSRQSGEMCVRMTVAGQKRPLRFCNTYVGGTGGGLQGLAGGPLVQDFAEAARLVDAFRFGRSSSRASRSTSACAGPAPGLPPGRLGARDGPPRQDGARARDLPARRRAGPAAHDPGAGPARMPAGRGSSSSRHRRGRGRRRGGRAGAAPGHRQAPEEGEPEDETGPRDVAALRREVAGLGRPDGVTASFRTPGRRASRDSRRSRRTPRRRSPGASARSSATRACASAARPGWRWRSGSGGQTPAAARPGGSRSVSGGPAAGPSPCGASSGASAGAWTPRTCASSPVSYISATMSAPPTSSPLTKSCGMVGHWEIPDSSWRMRGSGRMSTAANGAPSACRAPAVRAEKPQAGASGVPFMKRMTGLSSIADWIASRMGLSDMQALLGGRGGLEGEGVDRAADLRAEDVVDQLVLGDAREAGELGRDDGGAEVVPAARPVLHLGRGARQGGLDARLDLVRRGHLRPG
jgi:hypothetical protein